MSVALYRGMEVTMLKLDGTGILKVNAIPVVNPYDVSYTETLFLMWAGAYAEVKAYVWADSMDDAFEVLTEWLDDNAPGCLTWVEHAEDCQLMSDGPATGCDCGAEADITLIGHTQLENGDAIPSSEWGGHEVTDESYCFVKAVSEEYVAAGDDEDAKAELYDREEEQDEDR